MTDAAAWFPYLMGIIGFLIVYTLNGIRSEIKEVKTGLEKFEGVIANLDKRLFVVETNCHVIHKGD